MMKETNDSEYEAERRRKVADEKMLGAIIEAVERMRKHPVARSIMFRLFFLYNNIYEFQQKVKAMAAGVDPLRTPAPPFTTEQTNSIVKTYNSVIEDFHSHFRKKDSYVTNFSPFNELDEPTINDVAKTLFIMGTNISQIMSYMLRWMR